ncbi:MAG: ubiquitin-conjugating enzyme E2 [Asgard group archaeon]|nr:ubiquitin-conjugating enzyme E2 [Asgard group archaeon]
MSSYKNIPDLVLAREAKWMYEKGRGFEPIKGDMTRWRGLIPGRGEFSDRFFTVEIEMLDGFPATPPLVKMISQVDHPRVRNGNIIDLWITKKWNPKYHLFQVANSIKGLFAREPLRPAQHLLEKEKAPSSRQQSSNALAVYTKQRSQLQNVLNQKEQEIKRLRQLIRNKETVDISGERDKYLEKKQLEFEEQLFDIEEKFHWADISAIAFAKLYLQTRTQLQLIELISS